MTVKLERSIPYLFALVWFFVGMAVLGNLVLPHAARRNAPPAAADALQFVLAALLSGYFAAGLAVSALSVVHDCLPREKARTPLPLFSESRLRLWYVGLLLAAAAALPLDVPLARCCHAENCLPFLHDILEDCAVFGEVTLAVAVFAVIHQLDPPRRRALWWAAACVLLSDLAANGVKLLLTRIRPRDFDFRGGVCSTFAGWLPTDFTHQSFPSGHTAGAVALALALGWLYPKGKWLFLLLALLVACQRVECGAHYLSDVLCGAAVSCLTVACCLRLALWFSRFAPPAATQLPDPSGEALAES